MKNSVCCVIPNWNGKDSLGACLDSLLAQTVPVHIIVVENGSIDGSLEFVQKNYPQVELVVNQKNLGFAGGVNSGIRRAMEEKADFVALFNNDAVADKDWLKGLVACLEKDPKLGIATCKLMDGSGTHFDSTGDFYTIWGLAFPRGRDEPVSDKYDSQTLVFAASGGASLYRVGMLEKIRLFDEDFFAYYEDFDLSFRAQLAGWKIAFVPSSIAYHQIGATSGKIKGFTTYQAMKNLPWLMWKNVPGKLLWTVKPRFDLAYFGFYVNTIQRGQGWPATKGAAKSLLLFPKKLWQRHQIQTNRQVTVDYIWDIMTHDLPPNAAKLQTLRQKWWHLRGKT